jgi:ABC-type Fe3+-hydroxamate transport system substrate-binding protein
VRVVSRGPSATETLRAWGVDPVACTRFCEQADLPAVGGTKNPDVPAIVELGPDLVVLDEEENRREDHDALVAAGVPVHILSIRSVADLDAQLSDLAALVGASWDPVDDVPTPPGPRRPVVVPIWRRPWMVLGPDTYGASLLELLGFEVVPRDGGRYPTLELPQLLELPADVVLVPSEPYAFTDAHLEELAALGPAVRVDGQDLLWWGARTRGALQRLSAGLASVAGST